MTRMSSALANTFFVMIFDDFDLTNNTVINYRNLGNLIIEIYRVVKTKKAIH